MFALNGESNNGYDLGVAIIGFLCKPSHIPHLICPLAWEHHAELSSVHSSNNKAHKRDESKVNGCLHSIVFNSLKLDSKLRSKIANAGLEQM